jgi:hypothetical protein
MTTTNLALRSDCQDQPSLDRWRAGASYFRMMIVVGQPPWTCAAVDDSARTWQQPDVMAAITPRICSINARNAQTGKGLLRSFINNPLTSLI